MNSTSDRETITEHGLWSFKSGEPVEPYFSGLICEGCFSMLGGNRWDIEFKYNLKDEKIYEIAICQDCLDYIAQ